MTPHNTSIAVVPDSLRVLHIASGDLWAGAEVALFQLACALACQPHVHIEVVLLNEGELAARLRSSAITVHVINEQQYGLASLLMKLTVLIWRLRPQLVHTHRSKEHLLGALATALIPGSISLRTVHGGAESIAGRQPGLRDAIRQKLDRFIAGLQRCTIAVSTPLAAELAKSLPGMQIRTIVNGIDRKAIQVAAAQPGGLSAPGRIGICFAGRLVPVKRVDVFLAAARTVLDAHPERYVFYVIGDGPLRAQLEAQARELQLGNGCIFTGFLPNSLPLLGSMRALVLTSDHEGTPMVALEALALGVPVVAHAVGGLVPLLGSGAQGQLVRNQDPAGFASAIIATAPPDRQITTERHNLLPAEYRIETSVAAHLALYRELLARTPERH